MKRVINFIKLRYIMLALSAIIIVGGVTGIFMNNGFNLGIDYLAGLSQRVQIAPVAFSFTYDGNADVSLDIKNQAVAIEVRSAQGVETFNFPYSRHTTLRAMDTAFDSVPGLLAELRLPEDLSSQTLVAGLNFPIEISDTEEVLNAVPVENGSGVEIDDVRSALTPLGSPQIQIVGQPYAQEFRIRLEDPQGDQKDYLETQIVKYLEQEFGADRIVVKQSDYVGPRFSKNLGQQSVLLTVLALGLILVYIWFRFQLAYAVSMITALTHDVLIMLGFIAVTRLEVSTSTVAAVLTIIGYSLNDTIVVFDRIRENSSLMRDTPFTDVVNKSITQSLSRTMITSVTTLLAVTALFIFGEGSIKDFALNLIVGIVVGTYSSIFIASPVLHAWITSRGRGHHGTKKAAPAVETGGAPVSPEIEASPEKSSAETEKKSSAPVEIPVAQRKLKGKRQKKRKKK